MNLALALTNTQDMIFERGQGFRADGDTVSPIAFLISGQEMEPLLLLDGSSEDWGDLVREHVAESGCDAVMIQSEAWVVTGSAQEVATAAAAKAAGLPLSEQDARQGVLICYLERADGQYRILTGVIGEDGLVGAPEIREGNLNAGAEAVGHMTGFFPPPVNPKMDE